jgi:hypothetical protein
VAYKPLRPGPYPVGTKPDVFFRLGAPVDAPTRLSYEKAQTPWDTDQLNEQHLGGRLPISPLGDPIPFSIHLIGQLTNNTGYSTQFNLDSDRGFAYLTWDWIRNNPDKVYKTVAGQVKYSVGRSYDITTIKVTLDGKTQSIGIDGTTPPGTVDVLYNAGSGGGGPFITLTSDPGADRFLKIFASATGILDLKYATPKAPPVGVPKESGETWGGGNDNALLLQYKDPPKVDEPPPPPHIG